jgi:hypothetical protein
MTKNNSATQTSVPPTSSSYWVVPGTLLAGAYPGDPEPDQHLQKVRALVGAGIRTFVNLMEEGETDHAHKPFVPYEDLAVRLCPEVTCVRHPIRNLSVPSAADMIAILDAIDGSLNAGKPVYVHCWGGVGRTGTVVGCWLLRHRLAEPSDVLDVLMRLRRHDQERSNRMSPETGEQQTFVRK